MEMPHAQEQLADLNEASCQAYIAGHAAMEDRGWADWVIGKPLGSLVLRAELTAASPIRHKSGAAISRKLLDIQPIGVHDPLDPIPGKKFNEAQLEPPIRDYWAVMYKRVSGAVIGLDDDIESVIAPGTVGVNYGLLDTQGNSLESISSWDEDPEQETLGEAVGFARIVNQSVSEAGLIKYTGAETIVLLSKRINVLSSYFMFNPDHSFPLNRYEPTAFLEDYRSQMLDKCMRAAKAQERLRASGIECDMAGTYGEIRELYLAAAERAKEILEDRKAKRHPF